MRIRRHATNRIFLVGRGPPLKLVRFLSVFASPASATGSAAPGSTVFSSSSPPGGATFSVFALLYKTDFCSCMLPRYFCSSFVFCCLTFLCTIMPLILCVLCRTFIIQGHAAEPSVVGEPPQTAWRCSQGHRRRQGHWIRAMGCWQPVARHSSMARW